MSFITYEVHVYCPRLFSPDYIKKVNQKLDQGITPGERTSLIEFKRKLAKLSQSVKQLSKKNDNDWGGFESLLTAVIEDHINHRPCYMDALRREYELLRGQLEGEEVTHMSQAGYSLCWNALGTVVAGVVLVGSGFLMASGPVGIALLGAVMAAALVTFLAFSIYSMYVEGRYLAGNQFAEIENVLNTLQPGSIVDEETPDFEVLDPDSCVYS